MNIITTILITILNSYILYTILKERGYKYALIFSFVWDIIYFTLNNFGTGLSIPFAAISMIIIAIECYIKVSIDYQVFKKTNSFTAFLLISFILEFIITNLLTIVLTIIFNLFN